MRVKLQGEDLVFVFDNSEVAVKPSDILDMLAPENDIIKAYIDNMPLSERNTAEDVRRARIDIKRTALRTYWNIEKMKLMELEHQDKLKKIIETLPPEEKTVIKYRFGLYDGKPLTTKELAELLKTTEDNIKNIEKVAMDKLKEEQ